MEKERPTEKKKRELFQQEREEMVALGKGLFRSRGQGASSDSDRPYHSIDNFSGMSLLEHARPMFEVRCRLAGVCVYGCSVYV